MVLSITLHLTDKEVLQTMISLTGTFFTMASFVVNCFMLKKMSS